MDGQGQHGVFSAACFKHDDFMIKSPLIDGIDFKTAFAGWLRDSHSAAYIYMVWLTHPTQIFNVKPTHCRHPHAGPQSLLPCSSHSLATNVCAVQDDCGEFCNPSCALPDGAIKDTSFVSTYRGWREEVVW